MGAASRLLAERCLDSTGLHLVTPLKILHLVAPAEVGGLESVVRLLAKGQRGAGHDVSVAAVLSPGSYNHLFVDALNADGTPVVPIELPNRAYLHERRLVRQLCSTFRPNVVHTHGYRPDVVGAHVARALGIATVSTVHGFTRGGAKNRFYEWLQRQALRRFSAVVAVSRQLAAELAQHGVPAHRLHVIPNAFANSTRPLERSAARVALDIPEDRFIVGWVGRLSSEKGPDILVEAMARLRDAAVHAIVIGDGPDARQLEGRARRLGVADRMQWRGVIPEAGRLLPAFDALALSSRTEGTPIVLLEAMAAGVPIVATRVGGIPDVVTAAEAILIPPEDPAALAAAIEAIRTDLPAATARAHAARDRLLQVFRVEPWLARYEELYQNVQSSPIEQL